MIDFLSYSWIPIFINYTALPIGLIALYLRGNAVKKLIPGIVSRLNVNLMLKLNMVWILAISSWMITNVIIWGRRLSAPSLYYFESPWVQLKIGLLFLVILLELKPILLIARECFNWFSNKNLQTDLHRSQLQTLIRLNYIVLVLTVLLVIVEFTNYIYSR